MILTLFRVRRGVAESWSVAASPSSGMGHAEEESGDVHPLRLVMGRMSALAAGAPSIAPRDGAKYCVSHGLARPAEREECK